MALTSGERLQDKGRACQEGGREHRFVSGS